MKLLEINDSSYSRLIISPDKTSLAVISQFKSLMLLLQTIAEISSPALQEARLLETLTHCRFIVTSPMGDTEFYDREDANHSVNSQVKDESVKFYFEIICPCLQLVMTSLAVDGGSEARDNLEIQLVFQNKNLHQAIFNFLDEHSEGLMIPILELRDSTEASLRSIDALFEIIKSMANGPSGLPDSTISIMRRCPLLCRQFCESFVILASEFTQNQDIASRFDFSSNSYSEILDVHVKIISNLLSIFLTGDYIGKFVFSHREVH